MPRWVTFAVICAGLALAAQAEDDAEALLGKVRAKMKENLARVPDYACLQTVERWGRRSQNEPLSPQDTLRLEVGFVGDKEVFAWRGATRFEERELTEMVGAGTVGTGSFAIHATNVFLAGAPAFTYRGVEPVHGRPAARFDYYVPRRLSRYRIRVSPLEAVVAFRGSFWADTRTLDLIRLEVHADDIPEDLGLAQASEVMEYSRIAMGPSDFLLPKSSELTMVRMDGQESRNRRELSACREYSASAELSFGEPPELGSARAGQGTRIELPARLAVELSLDSEIHLERAALGDPVQAVLLRPLTGDEGDVLAPMGALVHGRLVRLDKYATPVPHYVVGLQFHILELDGDQVEFRATMEEARGSSALIRQARSMNPTFSRRGAPRLDILVRENQRGLGLLHWRASNPRINRGLRMRWLTDPLP